MIGSLLIFLFIVLIFSVRSIRDKKIRFDHFTLFSIGFVYYWLSPVVIISAPWGQAIFKELSRIYKSIPDGTLVLYFVACFALYVAYFAGTLLGDKLKIEKKPRVNYSRTMNIVLVIPFLLSMCFFVLFFRSYFFQGYSNSDNINMQQKGPFVATSLCLLVIALIRYFGDSLKKHEYKPANFYFFVYFICAFLIMSLGGRLYFISGLMIVLMLYHNYFKDIKASKIFLLLVLFAVSFSLIGVLRDGKSVISLGAAVFVFFAEPVFTSFTLFSFMANNTIELLRAPVILASAFINLIPTFLVPNKSEMMIYAKDLGISIYAPQGAMNSFVSFNINFGILGTMLFMFVFGALMQFLSRKKNDIALVVYYMLCFCMPFSFFRDDFQTSLIKNMFEFSVIVPLLFYVINRFLVTSVKKNNA